MIASHAACVLIQGQVQGVGYRYFAQELANSLGLYGWVRNNAEGDVEAYAEGSQSDIEAWIKQLKKGPPLSRVEHVVVDWQTPKNSHSSFSIKS